MSITETVILIGAFCGAIATIWALIERIGKPVKEINRKLDEFQSWQKRQQEDIEASKAEREIMCRGFRALCMWALGQGANGEISGPLEDLNQFLSRRSHEGKSYL